MARFWDVIRNEMQATVDDFRDKGAIGALRDAALDVVDMTRTTGGSVWNGVKDGVKSLSGKESNAVLISVGVPKIGETAPLLFPDGRVLPVKVAEVDGISEPPQANVLVPGTGELILVEIIDRHSGLVGARLQHPCVPEVGTTVEVETAQGPVIPATVVAADGLSEPPRVRVRVAGEDSEVAVPVTVKASEGGVFDSVKQEIRDTVQEFKEKGAVGTIKDASMDAVDLLGLTATSAINGARTVAAPLLGQGNGEPAASAPQQSGESDVGLLDGLSFDGLKQEWNNTVQDFRQKGVVGIAKDATLDAVDLLGDTATSVLDGARDLTRSFSEGTAGVWPGARDDAAAPATGAPPCDAATAEAGVAQTVAPPVAVVPPVAPPTPPVAVAPPVAPSQPAKEEPLIVAASPEVEAPPPVTASSQAGVPRSFAPSPATEATAQQQQQDENQEEQEAMEAREAGSQTPPPQEEPSSTEGAAPAAPAAPVAPAKISAPTEKRKSLVSIRRAIFEKKNEA